MVSDASRPRNPSRARTAAVLIFVCVGYYLGAQVGFALTLRPVPVSTLWPPNALLVAALLLLPTRSWWMVPLAALPAHLVTQHGAGIPPPMILGWFVSNCTEALIGAGGIRLLLRGPLRLDSVKQMTTFMLVVGFLAPFLSSFLDAGLVALNRFGESGYWEVWNRRFLSNVAAALSVATVGVTVGAAGLAGLRPASWRRLVEATLMTGGLLATCIAVFATTYAAMRTNPALMYAPLPFLLWAAVRFGPVGISTSLLGFALLAIWGATRGLGPFVGSSPEANAVSIKLFLVITAVPLLTLAAVIQERRRAERRARRNAERLSLALRAARMGIWEWHIGARRGSLSARARTILGLARPGIAVTTSRLLRIIHPEDRPALTKAMRRQLPRSGGLYEIEFRVPDPLGAVRWIRGSAIALSGGAGRPPRVLGVIADVTEKKRTLQAVQQSESRFRGVFEMGIVPMAFWRSDGRITDANDAYLRLTGFTRSEMEAGELWWNRLTAPECRHLDADALREVLGHGHCRPYEKEYLLRDGRRVPVQVGMELLGRDHGIAVEMDLTSRKRAEREIEARLRFERLVSDLSATFATARDSRSEDQIPPWLARLGEFLNVPWVRIIRLSSDHRTLRLAYAWTAQGFTPLPETLCAREFAAVGARLIEGRTVAIEDCGQASTSELDHAEVLRLGIGALLSIPLVASGTVFGALTLASGRPRVWPLELVHRLHLIADIFSNVMARKALEEGRRQAEAVNTAILASLPGMTAILDQGGRIVRVNDAWARNGHHHHTLFDDAGLGGNLLETCRRAGADGDPLAAPVLGGLEAVLSGTRRDFALTYPMMGGDGEPRWYDVLVQRLARREGGAVVTRLDCTARKQAELEAARNRADLAHVVRVATMGELTASLAHELSQPLTAIRSNAQAGSRMLASPEGNLEEIGAIFSDIVANDRRASDILARIRNLVRKGELELVPVDLNGLIREVARLLETDTLLRSTTTTLELAEGLPCVRGDRIQLQQVVLNLILNGLEAMAGTDPATRHLTISTAVGGAGVVHVGVRDTGVGIAWDRLDRVFDPFYTSKPNGLGMGLSIAKTIVRAHGGRIWAENHPDGGACVGFDLPVEQAS